MRVFDKNMRVQLAWSLCVPRVSHLSCSWCVPYFPCKEMLPFLIAVDLKTKEMANDQSLQQHGLNLIKIASDNMEKDNSLLLGFIELLVIKVPEINYMTIESMEAIHKELVRKLSHTCIQEYLDSFKQRAVASMEVPLYLE